jgi:hypothetical protein
VYSCLSCDYFRAKVDYELKRTKGALGIEKRIDLTRGLCERQNIKITSIAGKPTCKAYKPITSSSILSSAVEKQLKQPSTPEPCPRCRSIDIGLWNFDRERESYSCADCSYK